MCAGTMIYDAKPKSIQLYIILRKGNSDGSTELDATNLGDDDDLEAVLESDGASTNTDRIGPIVINDTDNIQNIEDKLEVRKFYLIYFSIFLYHYNIFINAYCFVLIYYN